jgi:hypothetical protein
VEAAVRRVTAKMTPQQLTEASSLLKRLADELAAE